MDIAGGFNEIFKDVFGEDVVVTAETTADDVAGWDSLSHAILLQSIEERFDVVLADSEALAFHNVGDMMDCVARLLARAKHGGDW